LLLHQGGRVVDHDLDQGRFGMIGTVVGVPVAGQNPVVVRSTQPRRADESSDHRLVKPISTDAAPAGDPVNTVVPLPCAEGSIPSKTAGAVAGTAGAARRIR